MMVYTVSTARISRDKKKEIERERERETSVIVEINPLDYKF